ncbi:hypothetical protein M408DRAFT_10080 [Serendipita vermifera MAFF 305830]|uniref:Uncharacterized protein n=1 Tax=Serendipita vermifera MAFF 305830 TaxID=933852 RepID=A0A0C2WI33_SERVB|nr:hypothetical protein M408DRAFT_10080 [Serendipita vermifera MAFF 305830]
MDWLFHRLLSISTTLGRARRPEKELVKDIDDNRMREILRALIIRFSAIFHSSSAHLPAKTARPLSSGHQEKLGLDIDQHEYTLRADETPARDTCLGQERRPSRMLKTMGKSCDKEGVQNAEAGLHRAHNGGSQQPGLTATAYAPSVRGGKERLASHFRGTRLRFLVRQGFPYTGKTSSMMMGSGRRSRTKGWLASILDVYSLERPYNAAIRGKHKIQGLAKHSLFGWIEEANFQDLDIFLVVCWKVWVIVIACVAWVIA